MRGIGSSRIARAAWCAVCLTAYLLLQAYFGSQSTEPRSGFGSAFGSLVFILAIWGLVDARLKKLRKS